MNKSFVNLKNNAFGIMVVLAVISTPHRLDAQETPQPKKEMNKTTIQDNILLAEFKGPYGGVPAFDKMDLDLLRPAMEKGMELHLQ